LLLDVEAVLLKKKTMRTFLLKKTISSIVLVTALSFFAVPAAQAQCPMCKMSAESNLENGGTEGKGLNAGILYMLVTPYLLVGAIGYIWWRNRRKEEESEEN